MSIPASGGTFYGSWEGCCSLCTRLTDEGCVAWTATVRPEMALVNGNRCVLYSSVAGPPVQLPEHQNVIRSGVNRREEAMTYIGLSMPLDKRWCGERNGQIMGSGYVFNVTQTEDSINVVAERKKLPLCRDHLRHQGRWVSLDSMACHVSGRRHTHDGWPYYNWKRFDNIEPEICYLKPEYTNVRRSSREPSVETGGYMWQPDSCRYDFMGTRERLKCLHSLNVTRFLDFGDSLMSTSRPPRTSLWLPDKPGQWADGTGAKRFNDGAEEQGCEGMLFARATFFGADSRSKTAYCGIDSYYQADPSSLTRVVNKFKPDVVLANWALMHRLWHQQADEWESFTKSLAADLDKMGSAGNHQPRFLFWLNAPFLVSEREPHCVQERAALLNEALRRVLEPRGWIELDWSMLTMKWALDIWDGVHHGPGPTRMLAYMLIHHVCHARVDGL